MIYITYNSLIRLQSGTVVFEWPCPQLDILVLVQLNPRLVFGLVMLDGAGVDWPSLQLNIVMLIQQHPRSILGTGTSVSTAGSNLRSNLPIAAHNSILLTVIGGLAHLELFETVS